MTPAEHYSSFVADLLEFCSQGEPIEDSYWDLVELIDREADAGAY